jgi:hypothetical protein
LEIDYFNPVVENWTQEDRLNEEEEKLICDIHFYLINSNQTGFYSIAEMVQSSNDPSKDTIVQFISKGFDEAQIKSIKAIIKLLNKNGATAYLTENYLDAISILNRKL